MKILGQVKSCGEYFQGEIRVRGEPYLIDVIPRKTTGDKAIMDIYMSYSTNQIGNVVTFPNDGDIPYLMGNLDIGLGVVIALYPEFENGEFNYLIKGKEVT